MNHIHDLLSDLRHTRSVFSDLIERHQNEVMPHDIVVSLIGQIEDIITTLMGERGEIQDVPVHSPENWIGRSRSGFDAQSLTLREQLLWLRWDIARSVFQVLKTRDKVRYDDPDIVTLARRMSEYQSTVGQFALSISWPHDPEINNDIEISARYPHNVIQYPNPWRFSELV